MDRRRTALALLLGFFACIGYLLALVATVRLAHGVARAGGVR
jgi:hypothetical protein